MNKTTRLIKIYLIFCLIQAVLPFNKLLAQQLPEEINVQNNQASESLSANNVESITVPADTDIIHLESMLSSAVLADTYAYAFDALNVEGAQDIISAFMENSYSLADACKILKNASFSLEDTFTAMVNTLGEARLSETIGALLEAKFSSGDVFKIAINHLKEVSPTLTDNQIITAVLGTTVDPASLKSLTQEIFIKKISSVPDSTKADFVGAMINSGFSLNEITNALSENGFSLDQIAKIYSLSNMEIGITYDSLLTTQNSQTADVIGALLASAYSKTAVFQCVSDKLSGTLNTQQITAISMGKIEDTGVSDAQLNNAIVLATVLHSEQISVLEISEAFITTGFSLDNTAVVLNGVGIDLDNSFTALVKANGGQIVSDVAAALINNGYDTHAVFTLSAAEFKTQGVGLAQIVQSLVGTIDADKGPTKNQKDNTLLLMDVLISANDSLANIAGALLSNGFSLETAGQIFKGNTIADAETYSALVSATGGQSANVALAMNNVGFSGSIVINLAVTDLKAQGANTADIISVLVQGLEEGKNPNIRQQNIAVCLIKILVAQSVTLEEIGTRLMGQGYTQSYVAKVLENAEINVTDAFSLIISIDPGSELRVVCESLKGAGYQVADVFKQAVTILQNQGQSTGEIISTLIQPADPVANATGAQIGLAKELAKYLISQGSSSQQIGESLAQVNFSLENIAKVMNSTGVGLETVFTEMRALSGGQDIGVLAKALINNGYKRDAVFLIAIKELKAQNYSTAEIINKLIGLVDAEKGQSSYQKTNSPYLLQLLSSDGGNLGEICGGFLNIGFSLDEIAAASKKVNIDVMQSYTALISANGGQASIDVLNALNLAGYGIGTLFEMIIPDLQSKNYSVEQITALLIGDINSETGLSSTQLQRAHVMVYYLSQNGVSVESICSGIAKAGFNVADNAQIVFRKIGNVSEAYNLLSSTYIQDSVSTVALGMIKAGYRVEDVLNLVVPILESQNLSMPAMISSLIGQVEMVNSPTALQLKIAASLTDIFIDKGNTLGDIAQTLFTTGIGLNNLTGILKTESTDFSQIYSILIGITPPQNLINVAGALISNGFNSDTVITTVVDELKGQGNNNAQITVLFLGVIDPKKGLTNTNKQYALALIKKFQADGASLSSVCNDLGSAGLTLDLIIPLMSTAKVSAKDLYTALLSFGSGQDPVALARALVTNKFKQSEVFELMVEHLQGLGSEYTVNKIIELVVGEIASTDVLDNDQLADGQALATVFLGKGISLENIASGFLSYGITLAQTTSILKKAGGEATATYNALNAVYQPIEGEVAARSVIAKMLSAGYDSFIVYSYAVRKLEAQGITNEAQVVNALIGPVDSVDSQQINNASKLSLVINFNKAKLTAENTEESFIALFKEGFSISQVALMLSEGGVSNDQVTATFMAGFNNIVKELAKSGSSPEAIVKALINQGNKNDCVRLLAKQLKLNDFNSSEIYNGLYAMSGGIYSSDLSNIAQGLADASNYKLQDTQEMQTVNSMLDNGYTLTEISQSFAEQGYQMAYVAKLFKTAEQPMDEIFSALENSKTAYVSNLMVNDTAASIVMLKYYGHKDVFTCATQYYKDIGISSEQITSRLMNSLVKIDSTNVLANAVTTEYYKSKTTVQTQSFITLIDAGYSINWIKDTLFEKDFNTEEVEAFVQDQGNFAAIYQGLKAKNLNVINIIKLFEVTKSPGEYTVLLAENMIKDKFSENEVINMLLSFKADKALISQGISRGLAG